MLYVGARGPQGLNGLKGSKGDSGEFSKKCINYKKATSICVCFLTFYLLSYFLCLLGQKGDQGMFGHIFGVSTISVSAQHFCDYSPVLQVN